MRGNRCRFLCKYGPRRGHPCAFMSRPAGSAPSGKPHLLPRGDLPRAGRGMIVCVVSGPRGCRRRDSQVRDPECSPPWGRWGSRDCRAQGAGFCLSVVSTLAATHTHGHVHTQIHTHARRGDTCTYTHTATHKTSRVRASPKCPHVAFGAAGRGTGPRPWRGNGVRPNPRDPKGDAARLRRCPGGVERPQEAEDTFCAFLGRSVRLQETQVGCVVGDVGPKWGFSVRVCVFSSRMGYR